MPIADVPAIASTAQPARPRRGGAARPARAGARPGLTLVDGARELGRALEGGVEVVEVFVDEARPDTAGRRTVDRALAAGAEIVTATAGAVLARLALRRPRGGVVVGRRPDPRPRRSATLDLAGRIRSSSSSRASRSRATWAPCCDPPMAPAPTP